VHRLVVTPQTCRTCSGNPVSTQAVDARGWAFACAAFSSPRFPRTFSGAGNRRTGA
jgi:hypothetical protein